jgi:hypothetical protein
MPLQCTLLLVRKYKTLELRRVNTMAKKKKGGKGKGCK